MQNFSSLGPVIIEIHPVGLSYLKDTAYFMKWGGARGLVGVAKLHPNFN